MVLRTVCPRDCYDTCLMDVVLEEGKITHVKGTAVHPFTSGFLCPKGYSYPAYQHAGERLRYPMRRTGKKGSGQFERITWDEALQIITQKINEISSEFSPQSILVYDYAGHLGFISRWFPHRVFNKMNASFVDYTLCDAAGALALNMHFGTTCGVSPLKLETAKLIIVWGTNLYSTSLHTYNKILKAKSKGAIVVVIDPIKTRMAEEADIFYQIKPGTDAFLAYGIIRLLIDNNLVDEDFIKEYTTGYEELRAVAGTVELGQIESITGIKIEKLNDFAGLLASLKPAIFVLGYGLQRRSLGGNTIRAISMLPVITGNISADAGIIYSNAPMLVNLEKFTRKNLRKIEERILSMVELGKTLTNTRLNPPVKMLFVYNSNPCATLPNQKLVRRGFEREDLFTVVHDIVLTETAKYADILLPAKTFFEFDDIVFSYFLPSIVKQNKIIDADAECVSNAELARMLAKALGFTEKDLYDDDATLLGEIYSYLPDEAKNSIDSEGYVILEMNPAIVGFPTRSGKIEISSSIAWKYGAPKVPLPLYEKTDELWLITSLRRDTIHTQFTNGADERNFAYLHPDDAEQIGVSNGDMILLESVNGKLELPLEIWDAVPRGCVLTYFSKDVNVLTTDEMADLAGGAAYNSTQVRVRKSQ